MGGIEGALGAIHPPVVGKPPPPNFPVVSTIGLISKRNTSWLIIFFVNERIGVISSTIKIPRPCVAMIKSFVAGCICISLTIT